MLQENIVTRRGHEGAAKKIRARRQPECLPTGEVANEMLNEMQRNNGGDTVSEDDSRYQVTVHLPDAPDMTDWTAKWSGRRNCLSLKTVNVIAAGKTVIVLDKSNKKLWDAALTYPVSSRSGPCIRAENPVRRQAPAWNTATRSTFLTRRFERV